MTLGKPLSLPPHDAEMNPESRNQSRSPWSPQIGHPIRNEMSSSHVVCISGSSASTHHSGGHKQQNKTDVAFSLSITTTWNLFEFEWNFWIEFESNLNLNWFFFPKLFIYTLHHWYLLLFLQEKPPKDRLALSVTKLIFFPVLLDKFSLLCCHPVFVDLFRQSLFPGFCFVLDMSFRLFLLQILKLFTGSHFYWLI